MKPLRLLTFLFGLLLIGQTAALLLAHRTEAESQMIVFAATDLNGVRLNPSHLFTIRPDGSGMRRLTDHPTAIFSSPEWSPDGLWLVALNSSTNNRLVRVAWSGQDFQQISPSDSNDCCAIWSRNGRRLFFLRESASQPSQTDLFRMQDNETQQISNIPGMAREITLSPDGKWLAFTVTADAQNTLWLMRPDGTQARQVYQQEFGPYALVWSGKGLYFVVRSDATSTIYRYDLTTQQAHLVYSGVAYFQNITPSPDGNSIAFIAQGPDFAYSMWRLDLATHTPIQLGSFAPYANMHYSPDGRWLLYLKSDHYEWHLYRMRPDGSNRQQISPDGLNVSSADWQPMIEQRWNGGGLLMIGVGLMGLAGVWRLPPKI